MATVVGCERQTRARAWRVGLSVIKPSRCSRHGTRSCTRRCSGRRGHIRDQMDPRTRSQPGLCCRCTRELGERILVEHRAFEPALVVRRGDRVLTVIVAVRASGEGAGVGAGACRGAGRSCWWGRRGRGGGPGAGEPVGGGGGGAGACPGAGGTPGGGGAERMFITVQVGEVASLDGDGGSPAGGVSRRSRHIEAEAGALAARRLADTVDADRVARFFRHRTRSAPCSPSIRRPKRPPVRGPGQRILFTVGVANGAGGACL